VIAPFTAALFGELGKAANGFVMALFGACQGPGLRAYRDVQAEVVEVMAVRGDGDGWWMRSAG
jgi:hypothetical protein